MTTEERMDAIRLRAMLDPDSLTEQQVMCLQIEQNGFGCAACSAPRRDAQRGIAEMERYLAERGES